jgi:4-hydroxybenzoate polyprenyltransferase
MDPHQTIVLLYIVFIWLVIIHTFRDIEDVEPRY